jgi:hypothetical protein
LLSELLHVEVLDNLTPRQEPLPIYVRPQPNEALGSWWLRFGRRFGMSAQALLTAVIGSDLLLTRDWSCRPAQELLTMTSDRTGIPLDSLRSMTMLDWQEPVFSDEVLGRFSGRRYVERLPRCPSRGLVVCPECFRLDPQPYIRLPWLIGWVASCERHELVMIGQCPGCRVPLRLPLPSSARPFAVGRCSTCAFDLRRTGTTDALPTAARLQELMLTGKRSGTVELAGIGVISWRDLILLSDVLLGMFWQRIDADTRWWLCRSIALDAGASDSLDVWRSREGSLVLLEWLLGAWSGNSATGLVADLGRRWREGECQQASLNVGPTIGDVGMSRVLSLLSSLDP